MLMKNGKIIVVAAASLALLLAGCGPEHTAKHTAKQFLKDNLADNAMSAIEYGSLDSTSFVSDIAIATMRERTAASHAFKDDIEYGEREPGDKLYFISVRYNNALGDDTKHTVYMDKTLETVVCVKDNSASIEK